MASKKRTDRIGALTRQLESTAKRLRKDVRKRMDVAGVGKQLESTTNQLRKGAASVVRQVEKYVHELRKDLEGSTAKRAKAKRRTVRRHAKPLPAS